MAELDYSAIITAAETQLRAYGPLRDAKAHVTQELDEPHEFPWVRIDIGNVAREPMVMTAGLLQGGPDYVRPELLVTVFAVSAQSAADARRQRDAVLRLVVDGLRSDFTLGGTVAAHSVTGIQFNTEKGAGDPPTIYASAVIRCVGQRLA